MKKRDCPHISELRDVTPQSDHCQECNSRFNLRMCTTCGHVGCCESQQAHNTKHAKSSGHPLILSLPLSPGSFLWCYECKDYLK